MKIPFYTYGVIPALLFAIGTCIWSTSMYRRSLVKESPEAQISRYERNLNRRMAQRSRNRKHAPDFVFPATDSRFAADLRHGYIVTNGTTLGWYRRKNGSVAAFREKSFEMQSNASGSIMHLSISVVAGSLGLLLAVSLLADVISLRKARRSASEHLAFLATFSHQVKGPLGALRRQIEILPPSSATDRLNSISSHLLSLVKSYLDSYRLANRPFVAAPIDVASVLEDMGEHCDSYHAFADPIALREILMNLKDNAVRHGAPPVSFSVCRRRHRILISVADCGKGIPPKLRRRILRPFFRIDSSLEAPTGYGLGLHVCSLAAKAMDAKLTVGDRSDGKPGSVFTLSLKEASHG